MGKDPCPSPEFKHADRTMGRVEKASCFIANGVHAIPVDGHALPVGKASVALWTMYL